MKKALEIKHNMLYVLGGVSLKENSQVSFLLQFLIRLETFWLSESS